MNIQSFFESLALTHLHNMHFVDEETGVLKADKYPVLLELMRQGIKELNTKFHLTEQVSKTYELIQGTHVLKLDENQDNWTKDVLRISQVMLIGIHPPQMDMQYLPESHEVISDARVKTLQTLERKGTDMGCPMYFLSDLTTVNLYSPYPFAIYQIICHTAQGADTAVNLEDELPIPLAYHNALGLYIASRVFRPMDNQLDGDIGESSRYYQAYQQEIQSLKQQAFELDRQPQYNTFTTKGFV